MSLEQAVQELTQATESLLSEVNTRKLDLVDAVDQADQAAQASTTQAGIATAKANLLGSVASTAATGTVMLTSESAVYQLINPNGAARDVVLPTLAAGDAGRSFAIKNTGTAGNYLTVKNAAGTQLGPLVANGYSMAVVWSGTAWEVL